MKKVLTIIATAALMLVATNSFAQAQLGAGYLNSVRSIKANADASASTSALNGFYAGVGYTLPIAGGLKVTPGIYYNVLMGSNASNVSYQDFSIFATKGNTQEHYLNVPVTFSIGTQISSDIKLFAYAGPTLSIGLISQTVSSSSALGGAVSFSPSTTDHYSDSNYGRFDVLVGGGLGVEFMKHLRFNVGYDLGLLNRYTGSGDTIMHRNQLVAGVSYAF